MHQSEVSIIVVAYLWCLAGASFEAPEAPFLILYRVSQKKGGLGFGFIVATLIYKLLINLYDKIMTFYDSQTHAGE